MTVEEIRAADAAYRGALERAEKLRDRRNEIVRRAVWAGWLHKDVAAVLGVTKTRVGQLMRGH